MNRFNHDGHDGHDFSRYSCSSCRRGLKHVHIARIFTIASLLCVCFSAGCADHPTRPSEIPLGQSFALHPGTSAILSNGLKVTFDGVRSDSRCPMDALCVWAGDAVITVSLSQPGAIAAERALHTDPTGSEAQYLSYVIKLAVLAPYPRSDRQIRPADYVATLTVAAR
jgi:hypothetical protein